MTNINNINESAPPFTVSGVTESKNKRAPSFDNLLTSVIDKGQGSRMKGNAANGLNEISSPAPEVKAPADSVSGKTDTLLSLLESYSEQLEDPQVSLKSIAPVLEEIKDNAGTLLEETRQLTDADESLKRIATQTAVTAQTEYVKFQRGDYVS